MIKREHIISSLSYAAVGGFSILFAFWLSTAFIGESRSQQQEPPVEVPQVEESALPADPALEETAEPGSEEVDENGSVQNGSDAPTDSEQGGIEQGGGVQNGGGQNGVNVELQSFLEPFIYDPKGRRDPFRPYTEVQPVDGDSIPTGPILPLQRFDLAELKLIGIIWDVRDPKAMFLDPNSRIYTIGKDERIGRNNGYVAAIREGEVVVIETFKRRDGEMLYTPRVIRMER